MSAAFQIQATPLAGLIIIQRAPIADERGYFERMYCSEALQSIAPGKSIVQINHSSTLARGSVRGLHFQRPPHAEIKMVSCLRGEVFDVAVDLRENSPTFLHWHAEILSEENHKTLAIPEGFAHGFQTLTDQCEMLYLHTAAYHPEAEDALNVRDGRLAILWPHPISDISPRDASRPMIDNDYKGVAL